MEFNETTPPPVAENGPDLTTVPEGTWRTARRRLEIIAQFARSPQRTRSGARQAAEELGCSIALIYRLLARYDADPRLTSFLPQHHGRAPGQFQLGPEVEDLIRAAIDDVYLTRQRPSVTALVRDIQHRCHTLGLPAPSRKAVRRRLSDRSAAEVMRRREGRKRARERFAPAIGSVNAPRPLSLVQIDHTLVDIILVDSVTRAPIRRPWLTLAIDVYSRSILGFYLSLDPPSATSVALCIAHAALPKDGGLAAQGIEGSPPHGLPE
jgi:putative transposase